MTTIYKFSKIYALKSKQTPQYFIRSTYLNLDVIYDEINLDYIKYLKDDDRSSPFFEVIKFGDFYLEKIEDYPCTSRRELKNRERLINFIHFPSDMIENEAKVKSKFYKQKYNKKMFKCPCGSEITNKSRYLHYKSIKHINFTLNLNNEKVA
jgi:hypothetical protein